MPVVGDAQSFAIEVVPVRPSWELRYGPEKAAWAGLAIWVDDRNLCRHIPAGTGEVQDYFYLPLGPIADWLIRSFSALRFEERAAAFPTDDWLFNSAERWADSAPAPDLDEDGWLDLRHSWWARHFLQAGADGGFVPNLSFVRNDENLVVAWRPPLFPPGMRAPEMLNAAGHSVVAWSDAEAVLDEFTGIVALWFQEEGLPDVFPWVTAERPLAAGSGDLMASIELLTGRSITEIEHLFNASGHGHLLDLIGLSSEADDPGASPECQVLRDLSPSLPESFGEVLRDLSSASRHSTPDHLVRWQAMREVVEDATRPALNGREAGFLAARAVRDAMGLNGQPVGNVADLASRCGLCHEDVPYGGGRDRMVVALRSDGGLSSRAFQTARTQVEWGRRFETARALGHVLLDPLRDGTLGAAAGPFAQPTRSRRSGVFAANLLLPEEAMADASNRELDGITRSDRFSRLLEKYGVGAQTAAHQLFRHGWLSGESARDELIDEYASKG